MKYTVDTDAKTIEFHKAMTIEQLNAFLTEHEFVQADGYSVTISHNSGLALTGQTSNTLIVDGPYNGYVGGITTYNPASNGWSTLTTTNNQ